MLLLLLRLKIESLFDASDCSRCAPVGNHRPSTATAEKTGSYR
jgi:hypothetical protein